MTITLAAVYAPIGFMGGLTGKLFTEFCVYSCWFCIDLWIYRTNSHTDDDF